LGKPNHLKKKNAWLVEAPKVHGVVTTSQKKTGYKKEKKPNALGEG